MSVSKTQANASLAYSETVSIPTNLLIASSLGFSLPLTALLTWLALPFLTAESNPILISISILAISSVLSSILLKLSKRTSIRVDQIMQFSGQRAATLVIRGGQQATTNYVPLEMITDVTDIEFGGNSFHRLIAGLPEQPAQLGQQPSFWQSFFALRTPGDEIPIADKSVWGYRGAGLLITYRAKTLTSSGVPHPWRLMLPTNHREDLKKILSR